jgi:hypothetical protein
LIPEKIKIKPYLQFPALAPHGCQIYGFLAVLFPLLELSGVIKVFGGEGGGVSASFEEEAL